VNRKKPLLLLDRDGTLITEQDYLKDPKKVRFLTGSLAGLQRLSKAGYPMVVISNQSGIGRGLMTERDVQKVMKRFSDELKTHGVRLKGIYWCPHHPNIPCACRKPKLGLVKKAARRLKRSWKGSISVGDKWCDVEMGQSTGGLGILVKTGYGSRTLREKGPHPKPALIARNFNAAARWILKNEQKELL
jgi:D-glycero-D-manno-heptose 1,7-bisphosphate phosphatase